MAATATAQLRQPGQPAGDDGPGRGVARISLLNGDVSVKRGDSGDLIAAALNAPLVAGDELLTAGASRAEIQFDYAHLLRVAGNTEVRFSELEYRRYQVQLATGLVTLRVHRNIEAEMEISTPTIAIRPLERGTYRVSVNPDGTTELIVRSGSAEVYTPRGSQRVRSGRMLIARGSASDPEYRVTGDPAEDDWDRWNRNRDRDFDRTTSYRYLPPDIYGADDLDIYGRWIYDDPYGWVWAPRVAVGWAPYRFGRWSWIDYWGWTWISHDPWGWAPYHWGRWYLSPRWGWCWFPGPRHFWRPALVGFFGWDSWGGFRAGIGFGFGNIGWVPLAPYEFYRPWWGWGGWGGRNRVFIDNSTTIVNNVNITNIYRNARVDNAITAVNAGNFGRSRVDADNLVRVSRNDLARVSEIRGALPLTPERGSLRVSDREARTDSLPRSREDQKFFSNRPANAVSRGSFEEQRQAVERVARATFGNEELRVPRGFDGVDRSTARGSAGTGEQYDARGSAGRGDRNETRGSAGIGDRGERNDARGSAASADRGDGWRYTEERGITGGNPSRGSASGVARDSRGSESRPAGEERGGWRRFGEPASRDAVDRGNAGVGSATRERESGGDRGSSVDRGSSMDRGTAGERGSSNSRGSSMERPAAAPPAGIPGGSRGSESRSGDAPRGSDSGWRRFGEPLDRGGSGSVQRDSIPAPRDSGRERTPDAGRERSSDTGRDRGGEPARTNPPDRPPRSNDDSGAWQRFQPGSGSLSGGTRFSDSLGVGSRSGDSGGWRSESSRPAEGERGSQGGWQRFEPRSEPRSQPYGGDAGRTDRSSGGSRYEIPRYEGGSRGAYGAGEPVRINPPIVRDRGAEPRRSESLRYESPRYEAPRYGGEPRGSYGGGMSAPRGYDGGGSRGGMSAPRGGYDGGGSRGSGGGGMSAPRGGGSGGSSRGSGGDRGGRVR
jgi:hypothetical protein